MSNEYIPLAARIRPENLDEIYGQEHILGKGKYLRRMIDSDTLSSIVLYGPPGIGKTTIANVIANVTSSAFYVTNATMAGKADMKKVVDEAKRLRDEAHQKTVLFIDEIHRFNKAQQDYLLPFVEDGVIVLIGATTENPYFEINGALLSRSQIFELKSLDEDAVMKILARAVTIVKKEYAESGVSLMIDIEAAKFWANSAGGDARQALNALDLALRTTEVVDGKLCIDEDIASECIQKKIKQYDKNGDCHYDTISAFIESMKHSEVDAALFYLGRMLDRGEDPKYIARRLMVCAYRDIGLADPQAFSVAVNAFQAVNFIGMPECADALAMSTIYNSMAPKSNTVSVAYSKASDDAKRLLGVTIPMTLRDESYKSAYKLGHGGVSDVFASPYHYDGFDCYPDEIKGHIYYEPSSFGEEVKQKKYYEFIEELRIKFNKGEVI